MAFKERELLTYTIAFVLLASVNISTTFAQIQKLSKSEKADLSKQAEASLKKGIAFFHSINTEGGYVYYVTPDLSLRWGESPADEYTIEVQPPGTPAVGQSFLRAYQVTADEKTLEFAKETAYASIRGQNINGGWDHTISFKDLTNEVVSFDDNQSQSAVSFLMAPRFSCP